MSLSDRINDTSAAPWVLEEIKKLKAERDALREDYTEQYQRSLELVDERNAARRERDAALEREQALAAHVERLTKAALDAIHYLPGGEIKAELRDAYDATPETSLARRDLLKQAEVLEESARAFKAAPLKGECRRWHHVAAGTLEREAAKLRRQAVGGEV